MGNIERRGKNSWRLKVSAGFDLNGKRKVQTKTVRAKDRKEAEVALAAFIAEVKAPGYQEPENMTFREYAEIWLEDHAERNLQPKTITGYKSILERRILPELGGMRISKITPLEVNRFYSKMAALKKVPNSRSHGTLSNRTLRHYHVLLNKMMTDAVQLGIIKENPTARVSAPRVKPKPLEMEDSSIEELLLAIQKEELRYRALVLLTLGTGMRLGEVTGLEWKHIDFENKRIFIKQSAQYIAGRGIIVKEPKSYSSNRVNAIPEEALNLLKKYYEEQDKYPKCTDKFDWVFRNPDGSHMKPPLVSGWFARFLRKHGISHLRFHDLRHLSATLSLQNGISPTNVAARLGHSKTSTTMDIYSHAFKSVDIEAAEKLNNVLKLPTRKQDSDVNSEEAS